jgi:rubrerythrin
MNEANNMSEENKIAQEVDNVEKIFSFMSEFEGQYMKEADKLPYYINLLDELRADENAHSRILAKLLNQKTPCGKFEILESFIKYIKEKAKEKTDKFEKIKINDPVITTQKGYIDLWIRDKEKYAIIVENKIHTEKDEEKQLSNYIEETMRNSFKKEQIWDMLIITYNIILLSLRL